MKKQILLIAVLFALTSCTTIGNFWESVFGRDKDQPIPANKRTPLLNQYPNAGALVPNVGSSFAVSAARSPVVPEAPDPFGTPVPYTDVTPAPFSPPVPYGSPAVSLGNRYPAEVLPSTRRVPEFNEQARNSQLASTQAPAVFVPPKLPENLPNAGGFPKLSQVPPAAPAPRSLNNDPRVADLQNQLAQNNSQRPLAIPAPPLPIDNYDPAPVPMPKVAKTEIPGNVPAQPVIANRRPLPSTPPRYLPPLPAYEPEPIQEAASTDVSKLRPISTAFEEDSADEPKVIPNKVELLNTGSYERLRRIRAAGGTGGELARHSALN